MKKYITILFLSIMLISCSKKEIDTSIEINAEVKTNTIVALWDSLTAWFWVAESENYPHKLENKLVDKWYNYTIINAWVSWDTSSNLKSRAALYLEKKPEIAILVIGWNDWLRGLSIADLKQNILEIIDLYEKEWVKIVLCWMDVPANLWLNYRNSFQNVYKEIVKERKNIYFYDFFLEWVAWNRLLNIDDMIHPNWTWYDIIVENLYKFLIENNIVNK